MTARTLPLTTLIPELPQDIEQKVSGVQVSGVAIDSRKLACGDLFIALPGAEHDGRSFIAAAIASGASAVLVGATGSYIVKENEGVPVIELPDLSGKASSIVAKYYDYPSDKIRVVGFTGTNGKTSCSHYLAQMLDLLGERCGVMGTLGCGFIDDLKESANTTADTVTTQSFIAELVAGGVQNLAMEVSSHGLVQGRIDAIHFDSAVFTNLTRDHLDYHGSMEEYARAKSMLFASRNLKCAVINEDDRYAALMKVQLRSSATVVGFSLCDDKADVSVNQIRYSAKGIHAWLMTPWGEGQLNCPLMGSFNLANVLAVISVLGLHGYALPQLIEAVSKLLPVDGRMQLRGGDSRPLVVVDYAHTPDALSSLLSAVTLHTQGDIICVFGCGGDRDKGKRPLMAKAAMGGSQHTIITSDNPRSEKSGAIIADVISGVPPQARNRVETVEDRTEAICAAFSRASANDVIVVAGKGHETYQEINGVRYDFNDVEVVDKCLQSWQGVQS